MVDGSAGHPRRSTSRKPMPTYEYQCEPCRIVYETMHGMNDPPIERCPKCGASVSRLMSAPRLNRYSYSSPTEAKFAKVYPEKEIAKEKELQKVYERVWLPPPVIHSPWD
jgi:putative FmdB family regulatory protein